MPDWRDNQIEDNIRGGFISNLNTDASNKKSRLDLDNNNTIPTNDLTSNHKPTNDNGFGVIANDNGSGSVPTNPVGNGGNNNGGSFGENDFGYYDWPAIDNFEDVDRLFRNSDATYGQKEAMDDGGGEELSWFANSSDALYASEMDALTDFATYSNSKPGIHSSSADPEVDDAFASNQMECDSEEMGQLVDDQTYNGCSLNGYGTLDMGSSSYLTFSSYHGTNNSPSPIAPPPAQKIPSVINKKVEKLKNGQLANAAIQQPSSTKKLSFDGSNFRNDFEKGASESKNILASSMVVNGSTNNNSSAFSTNDMSVEESSFMQLQDVMNQLDVPTKICIRDGLYRLARSVQQRNDYSNTSSNYGNENAQYSAINNGFVEPINPETGTNPIDRSIAELLFHQPPETTIKNIEESVSPKSRVSNEHNNKNKNSAVPCSETKGRILSSSELGNSTLRNNK